MKALLAATCVALLAAVGYFFYGEYMDAQARAARQASVDEAMTWLYRLSEAERGDTKRVAQFCHLVRTAPNMRESAEKLGAPDACRTAGF